MSGADEGWAYKTVPGAPKNVSATDGTHTDRVVISWNPPSDGRLDSYNVYRSDTLESGYALISESVIGLSHEDNTGAQGTVYYYKVSAVNVKGETQSAADAGHRLGIHLFRRTSPHQTARPLQRLPLPGSGLLKLTRLMFTGSSSCDGEYTKINTDPVTSTGYTDSSLSSKTTYYYRVTAVNQAGESDRSVCEAGSTMVVLSPPPAPDGVSATDGTSVNSITVTWNAAERAASYNVYRSSQADTGYVSIATGLIELTYVDTPISAGGRYYYKVSGVNTADEGDLSLYNEGYRLTPPDPPASVSATNGTTADMVNVTWSTVAAADSYNVYRSATLNGEYAKINPSAIASTSYNDTSVNDGAHYFYKIKSVLYGTEGAISSADEGWAFTTAPLAPRNVVATDGTYTDRVEISWNAPSDGRFDSYRVYRSTSLEGTYRL